MEISREIYWNVGNNFTTISLMYLFTFLSMGYVVYLFYKRYKVYQLGKPLNRTDNLKERIKYMLTNMAGQIKVRRRSRPGIAHSIFFWSFIILFIGTFLVFVQADITDLFFDYVFLKGDFYKVYSVSLDIAGLVGIVMLGGLFIRRFVFKPKSLVTSKEDTIIHVLLFAILITGFLIEGVRMAATELKTNPEWMIFSPVGMVIANMLSNVSDWTLLLSHKILWWIHLFIVLAFFIVIPVTKLRHMFTITANYVFKDNGPTGKLVTLNMEDENIESFGVSKVTDFTWKDIFDADACINCSRCQDVCPANATEKPLSPMSIINRIGDAAFNDPSRNLIDDIGRDSIWSCTTCRACEDICPANNEHVNKIIDFRRNLVLMEGEFAGDEVMQAMDNVEVNGNPMGLAMASRGDWAIGLDVVIMSDTYEIVKNPVDVLYYVGCYASFDARNQKIAKNFVEICNASGIKVGILGKEEKCCGEPIRKMGNEYLYQELAKENILNIGKYNVLKIVTTCPHCFNTLNKDYRDLGFETEVEHYTVFLDRLEKENRIPMKEESFDCTYHDSCYLVRHNDIDDQPRSLLNAAGANIIEMDKSRKNTSCCGAGGGRILAEEHLGTKINIARVNMAQETGAPVLISNCPFCLTMFEDGIKMADCEDSLVVKDLSEIIVERLRKN
jgi:Fe-S oxidoreductase/nitrate reductase gamma subunit